MKKRRVRDRFIEELKITPIVQVVCDKLGISRQTFYRWKEEDSLFSANVDVALNYGESFVNDVAESNLLRSIKNQNMPDTKFWLTRRHPKFKKVYEHRDNNKTVVHDKEASRAFFKRWTMTPETYEQARAYLPQPRIPVSENQESSAENSTMPLSTES